MIPLNILDFMSYVSFGAVGEPCIVAVKYSIFIEKSGNKVVWTIVLKIYVHVLLGSQHKTLTSE